MSAPSPTSPTPPVPVATASPAPAVPVTPPATGTGDPAGIPAPATTASIVTPTTGAVPGHVTPAGAVAPVTDDITPSTATAEDLAAVRTVVLAAHPDAVPELVRGETVADLLASVGPAREAFARIAATVREPGASTIPTVPAGSSPALPPDPDLIPATEKIKRALLTR